MSRDRFNEDAEMRLPALFLCCSTSVFIREIREIRVSGCGNPQLYPRAGVFPDNDLYSEHEVESRKSKISRIAPVAGAART